MPTFRLAHFLVLLTIASLLASPARMVDAQEQSSKQSKANTTAQAMELTAGEKKAVAVSEKQEANTLIIFDKQGDVKTEGKIDPKKWDGLKGYVAKICAGPVPISPKCVRCKSGEIICAYVPSKDH